MKPIYKDCDLMKRYLRGDLKVSTKGKQLLDADANAGKEETFLEPRDCLMIFGNSDF